MGEIMGAGITHYPGTFYPDDFILATLWRTLRRPGFPEHLKDPSAWPELMQQEWGNDEGHTAAQAHRKALKEDLLRVRKEIDEFKPDLVMIWGDDQYENFREDLIPPFAIFLVEESDVHPFASMANRGVENPKNVRGESPDATFNIKVHTEAGKYLFKNLLDEGFDVSYAYKFRHVDELGHAFSRVPVYLDYDNVGFPYPIVPLQVNCYGRNVFTQGGPTVQDKYEGLPSPSPARCFALGRAVARVFKASPWRVCLLASSSWSHAFLTPKHDFLYPDSEADRRLYEALRDGDFDSWSKLTLEEIEYNGQPEVLNWVCLAGAMCELNMKPSYTNFVESHLFNSSKTAAVYRYRLFADRYEEGPLPSGRGPSH